MDWDLILHKNEKYIEIITKGVADNDGSLEMAKVISDTMHRKKLVKVLVDHRNISGITGNTIEIYNRPKAMQLVGFILGVKIAEIIKPEHIQHFRFFETVCKNQGFSISIFKEKAEALNWLLS